MPQYSGIFTLPQQAQALTSGQWCTDPYFKNTTLLLHADGIPGGAQNSTFLDSSSNAFAITPSGKPKQGTFSPYMPNGYWSNYFDGTGDYLTLASSSTLALGSGDFTLEFWVYIDKDTGADQVIFDQAASNTLLIYVESTDKTIVVRDYGVSNLITTTPQQYNTWIHVALSRASNTMRLFINGAQAGSVSNSTNLTQNGTNIGRFNAGGENLAGYLSNFRIVKGTAVYTSNFTPSTAPLTAITNTSLLTCQSNRFLDNSTNAFTVTPAGDVKVQQFQPFMRPYQYSTSVIGGSGYFDGTGDYLTTSSTGSFNPSSGNWTIEGWMYCTSSANNDTLINGNGNIYIAWLGTTLYFGDGAVANTIVVSNSKPLNQWFHVAAVKNSSTYTVYLNGTSIGSSTTALSNTTIPSWTIGYYSGTSGYVNGYISNLRVVKGTAVYTSNFTPPTTPLTAITNTSLLCNMTNAGIYDNAMQNNLSTEGNAQVSTSVVKYGSGSMYFDGTGDYLTFAPVQNYIFGTGDFTVEFWLYLNAIGASQYIVGVNQLSGNAAWFVQVSTTGTVLAGGFTTNTTSTSVLAVNTWNHIAVVMLSGSLSVYINGVQSGTPATGLNFTNTGRLFIGSSPSATRPLNGYIDDLRITKGVARYTSNFQPPQVAFANQ